MKGKCYIYRKKQLMENNGKGGEDDAGECPPFNFMDVMIDSSRDSCRFMQIQRPYAQ